MSYISKLALGGSMLGSVSGLPPEKAKMLVKLAHDEGVRFYDTANIYGQGDSERVMSYVLEAGDGSIIGTKGGYSMPTGMGGSKKSSIIKRYARNLVKKFSFLKKWLMRYRSNVTSTQNFTYAALKSAAQQSAIRLGVDRLPLYMLHSPSKQDLENGIGLDSLNRLKEEGLIDKVGMALLSIADIDEVSDIDSLDYIQVELNLMSPPEDFNRLEKLKKYHDLQIVVRQPFAGGVLLNTDNPRASELSNYASQIGMDLAHLALATLLKCEFVDQVIVGTTNQAHLRRNIQIANTPLSDDIYKNILSIVNQY